MYVILRLGERASMSVLLFSAQDFQSQSFSVIVRLRHTAIFRRFAQLLSSLLLLPPPKKEEVGRYRIKIHMELHNFYSSPNFRVTKRRKTRQSCHLARIKTREMHRVLLWENLKRKKKHSENLGLDRKQILRWVFNKMEIINLTQNKNNLQPLVTPVMNFLDP